jgi:hypothetical protein
MWLREKASAVSNCNGLARVLWAFDALCANDDTCNESDSVLNALVSVGASKQASEFTRQGLHFVGSIFDID